MSIKPQPAQPSTGRHRRRVRLLLVLSTLAWAPLGAADISFKAEGLKAPVFDAAGILIRRLTAASATGPLESTRLERGRIEFFAPGSAEHATAVLDFDEALYRKSDESIRGGGLIRLVDPQGTVSGRGYECWLDTGLLTLGADVTFSSSTVHVTGRDGEIRFDPKTSGSTGSITSAVVTHATVERTATAKAPFDRAETELARYSAAQQKLFLKTPLILWKDGRKAVSEVASGFYEIDLTEKPDMALLPPAATNAPPRP
ncbi:MAG: hypothetical protein ABUL68_05245 [Pseudomonadota bacterium]